MDYQIRPAVRRDVPALAELHVATFNETHSPLGCGPTYALRESQWRAAFGADAATWFAFVAVQENGGLLGFAKGTRHDGGVPGFDGELNKIYVLRAWQRRGIGRALVCAVARRFLAEGVSSMLLFGDAASPSNRFYEALGAQRLVSDQGEFHGGYGWRDLRALAAGWT